jgi:hypothetical protein
MNFHEVVTNSFSDRRIFVKSAYLFGISFVSSLILLITQIVVNVFYSGTSSATGSIVVLAITLLISILTIPLWLYLQGYKYRIAIDYMQSNNELPEHDNFGKTVSLGGATLTFSYTLTFPLIIVSLLPILIGGQSVQKYLIGMGAQSVLGFSAALLVLGLLFGIVLFVIGDFIVPVMMYTYIRTGKYSEAFSFRRFIRVVKSAASDWVLYFLLMVFLKLGGIVITILAYATCILIPIITPLIEIFAIVFTGALLGSIYKRISSDASL